MASACMVFLPFIVFDHIATFNDNSAASSFVHAPLHACKHAGNSNVRVQCTEISIPKCDGHTCIHTYRRKTRCEAGLAALR